MMKKTIALLLALTMLCSLVGCTGKPEITGTYQAKFDLYDSVVTTFDTVLNVADTDFSLKNYLDEFNLTFLFVFNEDGTYSIRVDSEASAKTLEQVKDAVLPLMNDMLFSTFKQRYEPKGFTVETREDLETIVGMTWDEVFVNTLGKAPEQFVSDLIDSAFTNVLSINIQSEGKFKAAEGKLYLSDSLDTKPPKDSYRVYTRNGDSVTITEAVNIQTDLFLSYPCTLTRIEAEAS